MVNELLVVWLSDRLVGWLSECMMECVYMVFVKRKIIATKTEKSSGKDALPTVGIQTHQRRALQLQLLLGDVN